MKRIRAVVLDVDGVLTDGAFIWGPNGEEFKSFSFRDVMGISLARKSGMIFALISGEASPLVDRFARKMGITDVHKGCTDKAAALEPLLKRPKLHVWDYLLTDLATAEAVIERNPAWRGG